MLVSDVARRVRSWSGNSGTALASDADFYDMINDAQVELNAESGYLNTNNVAINTVAGTHEYSLDPVGNTFISVKSIKLLNYWTLEPSDVNRIVAADPTWKIVGQQRLGTPRYYAVAGEFLQLYPTPDAVYTLNTVCAGTPTQVTQMSDPLTLPEYMHPSIARLCFATIKEKDEDFEASAFIKAEVFAKLPILIDKARNSQEQSFPSVRDYDNSDRGYDRVDW